MSDLIEGKNPVMEALKSGHAIDKLLIARGERSLQGIIDAAREKNIPIQFVEKARIQAVAETPVHQGVIAYAAAHEYAAVEDILARAGDEKPFVIVLDDICDPHNLGSILRTANAAGAHGVIIPKRGAVGLNSTVAKVSAGAVEYTPVARVPNIAACLEDLKKKGFWIYGAAGEGAVEYTAEDYRGAVALVIGSEGGGISRLIREKCDFLVKIPMLGEIESLNASVAAGVLMYEIRRQRGI